MNAIGRLKQHLAGGPSSTSEVTSSPRCAGRQCMKMTSRDAFASKLVVDLIRGEHRAPLFGLVLPEPMLAQTSV